MGPWTQKRSIECRYLCLLDLNISIKQRKGVHSQGLHGWSSSYRQSVTIDDNRMDHQNQLTLQNEDIGFVPSYFRPRFLSIESDSQIVLDLIGGNNCVVPSK